MLKPSRRKIRKIDPSLKLRAVAPPTSEGSLTPEKKSDCLTTDNYQKRSRETQFPSKGEQPQEFWQGKKYLKPEPEKIKIKAVEKKSGCLVKDNYTNNGNENGVITPPEIDPYDNPKAQLCIIKFQEIDKLVRRWKKVNWADWDKIFPLYANFYHENKCFKHLGTVTNKNLCNNLSVRCYNCMKGAMKEKRNTGKYYTRAFLDGFYRDWVEIVAIGCFLTPWDK